MATDDIIFMRSKKHGKLKIKKSAVPGGLFTIDAEFYLLADKPKNREKPIKQPFPEQK
jgi:hypothetical protein